MTVTSKIESYSGLESLTHFITRGGPVVPNASLPFTAPEIFKAVAATLDTVATITGLDGSSFVVPLKANEIVFVMGTAITASSAAADFYWFGGR